MAFFALERWSPYLTGIGIGVLSWFAFLLSKRPLGVSTAFVRVCGLVEKGIRKTSVTTNPYYQKFPPVIEWELIFIAGLLFGSFAAALLSGTFRFEMVPPLWASCFGTNSILRVTVAICGGILVGIGARWAGGCTSGHGISGTLQLAVSSWIAVIAFFIGGALTANLLYRVFVP